MPIDPSFASRLTQEQIEACEAAADVVYGVDADGRLAFTNAVWDRFAHDNGGEALIAAWPLGRSVWESVPEVLGRFYRQGIERYAAGGEPWEHDYECSSPDERRLFHMRVLPVNGGGLLVLNALRDVRPHADPVDTAPYVDADGLVHQCAHCRRVRVTAEPDSWRFVPALLARPHPKTSHSLCEPCFAWHYPDPGPPSPRSGGWDGAAAA